MTCPGSVALCEGLPESSSVFADEGTDAHELAAICLEKGTDAVGYIGQYMGKGNQVTVDMARHVQSYVDYVREVVKGTGGELRIEQRLPIDHITAETDAHGTSDAVVLTPSEIIIIDLKFGMGVEVSAENNPQLQIYALGALEVFSLAYDFKTVRMVIHQPRIGSVSEWVQPITALLEFGVEANMAAFKARQPDAPLVPSEKGCKWCKAKATCPKLAQEVLDSFEAIKPEPDTPADQLALAMSKVDLIESWVKAIRAETETRLLAGVPVPGFKLVQGKRGNRAWTSADEAEKLLKALRVKHDLMYDYKVISPTTAEKLKLAGDIGPRQWPKVQALITQAEGKPSVAPESDKRPALVTSAESDFVDVTDLV